MQFKSRVKQPQTGIPQYVIHRNKITLVFDITIEIYSSGQNKKEVSVFTSQYAFGTLMRAKKMISVQPTYCLMCDIVYCHSIGKLRHWARPHYTT